MFLKTFLRKCFRKEKKKPEEIFIDACKRGDLGLVRECLRQGVDVNSGGCAGLEEAIIGLNTEVASLLLAQPNIELTERHLELALTKSKEVTLKIVSLFPEFLNLRLSTWRETPLLKAVKANQTEIVEELSKLNGVDLNDPDWFGNYPITTALINGNADIVNILLSKSDLNLNVRDRNGRTLPEIALDLDFAERRRNSVRCFQLVSRDRRVDWNVKTTTGESPVMRALREKKMPCVKILVTTANIDLTEFLGNGEGKIIYKIIMTDLFAKMKLI